MQPNATQPLPLSFGEPLVSVAVLMSAIDRLAGESQFVTVSEAVQLCEREMHARGALKPSSEVTVFGHWHRFERYLRRGHGVTTLAGVTTALVESFIHASSKGAPVSVATKRSRRTSLRILFAELRHFRLWEGDPTLDIDLPARPLSGLRPLTDEEVERCEWASQTTLMRTREPATLALAETGASPYEVGRVTRGDVDVATRTVWLAGGPLTSPRRVGVTEWGLARIDRQLRMGGEFLASEHPTPMTGSRVAAVLQRIFRRAGLGSCPDLGPRSVTAWAGRRILDSTGSIEAVASGLGMRSLDLAAQLIQHDWQDA